MTETVPADIAAAIANHGEACARAMKYKNTETWCRAIADARAALNAAILHHLSGAERCCDSYARENQRLSDAYAEMKAALERIEQGV